MIRYRLLPDGGFVAGDTTTNRTNPRCREYDVQNWALLAEVAA